MEAVTNCSTLLWNAETALSHRSKILNADENSEYQCLMAENDARHKEKEACDRVHRHIESMTDPGRIKDLPNKTSAAVLQDLKENKEWYNKTYKTLYDLYGECVQKGEQAAAKHKE